MPLLDDLMPIEDESIERILVRLLQSDDIALKTDLPNAMNVVKLQAIADILIKEGMIESGEVINNWVTNYMKDMVSSKRKGRGEIVKALTDRIQSEERSRWTGRVKDGPEE